MTKRKKVPTTENTTGIISIIGINALEAIVPLVDALVAKPSAQPNEVQVLQSANGLACAVVTISVLVLESAINRMRYIRREICDDDNVEYFAKIISDGELAKDIDEVVAIRDAVVHNHLWEADVTWDDDLKLRFAAPPKLLDGFGNKRQRRVMEPKTRLSRRLGLNLFPVRIGRYEAFTALRTIVKALAAIEAREQMYFPFSNQVFEHRREMINLRNYFESLPAS